MAIETIVLFSGGQDSTTCLAQASSDCNGNVLAVCFDYGQRHSIELEQAKKVAGLAGIPLRVIDMRFISQLTPNALTDTSLPVEHLEGDLPSTFVPGRNLFFLSVGAVIARQVGASIIYMGVCQADYSGYPDCREAFVKSAEETVRLALDYDLEVRTPLMWKTKAETVLLMKELGNLEWYKETHTCYEGHRPPCGTCPACLLREKGFSEAGIDDPLVSLL